MNRWQRFLDGVPVQLGVWGSFLWLILMGNNESITSWHFDPLNQLVDGYIVGYIAAFFLYFAARMLRGDADMFITAWFDYIILVFWVVIGSLAVYGVTFGDHSRLLTAGAVIGGFVVTQGLGKWLDTESRLAVRPSTDSRR